MAYTIIWEDNGVVVNLNGNVDISEIDRAGSVLYLDKRFLNCKYQIFDFLASDVSSVSLEDVGNTLTKDVLASITIHNPSLALVSNSNILTILAEHYMKLSKRLGIKWNIKVFCTREEAEKWCKDISNKT